MHLTVLQIILITIFAFIAINDSLISNSLTQPAIAGMISGLIMGDLKTGLMVGGTLQLMRLGIQPLVELLYLTISQVPSWVQHSLLFQGKVQHTVLV